MNLKFLKQFTIDTWRIFANLTRNFQSFVLIMKNHFVYSENAASGRALWADFRCLRESKFLLNTETIIVRHSNTSAITSHRQRCWRILDSERELKAWMSGLNSVSILSADLPWSSRFTENSLLFLTSKHEAAVMGFVYNSWYFDEFRPL